jgi:putative transposase
MCQLLNISRQTYYNYANSIHKDKQIKMDRVDCNIFRTFINSRGSFGTRMIKATLARENIYYSRKTIANSMKRQGLSSSYNTSRKSKVCKSNKDDVANALMRDFKRRLNEVLTSDLTYVKVRGQHHYVCFIVDLYNSEIVGYKTSKSKTPEIVLEAMNTIKFNLKHVSIFHSDRGGEYKNEVIDKILTDHDVIRSLSRPGSPVDNALSESAFKTFKQAWYQNRNYEDELELQRDVEDYVR